MNIVFWVLVVLALALTWFCMSSVFNGIGGFLLDLFNDAKEEIKGDESEKNKRM